MSIDRRHFLLGSTAAGIAGIASGRIHDGELGGPVQVIHGAVPWQEGTADSPPGVSGSGYSYFTNIEAAFVEAALVLKTRGATGSVAQGGGRHFLQSARRGAQYGGGPRFPRGHGILHLGRGQGQAAGRNGAVIV